MDTLTLRTSVRPELKRTLLIRGMILAVIGLALLMVGGIFLPPETLKQWGFPLFLVSILCIGGGLIPYKRVVKLESAPDSIVISDRGEIHYKGKTYRMDAVEKVEFYENRGYGIKMTLKTSETVFLPYFSKRSCEELQECLELR
jgi:hypothetical protein